MCGQGSKIWGSHKSAEVSMLVQRAGGKSNVKPFLLSDLVLVNGITCADAVALQTTNTFWKVEYAAFAQIVLVTLPMLIVLGHVSLQYILRPFWNYARGRNGYQSLEMTNDSCDFDLSSGDRKKSFSNSSTSTY